MEHAENMGNCKIIPDYRDKFQMWTFSIIIPAKKKRPRRGEPVAVSLKLSGDIKRQGVGPRYGV